MLQCWEMDPKGRLTFSDLVRSLSQSLEAMVDYMDSSVFGTEAMPETFSEKTELLHSNSSEKEPSQIEPQKVMLELTSNETNV